MRRALLELYGPGPDGLSGNDDGGTMGAWWVFGALGIYPAIPGTDVLALGSPLFRHVAVRLPGGTLRIDAPRAAPGRPYVRSLSVDGAASRRPWLRYRRLAGGARLSFGLGATPTRWGSGAGHGAAVVLPARRVARRKALLGHRGDPTAARVPAAAHLPGLGVAGHGLHAAEEEVLLLPAPHPPAAFLQPFERRLVHAGLGVRLAALHVDPRRRHRVGGGAPWSTTPRMVWRIAERMRFEPAEPSASSGLPSRSTTVGAIMLGTRVPGTCRW